MLSDKRVKLLCVDFVKVCFFIVLSVPMSLFDENVQAQIITLKSLKGVSQRFEAARISDCKLKEYCIHLLYSEAERPYELDKLHLHIMALRRASRSLTLTGFTCISWPSGRHDDHS